MEKKTPLIGASGRFTLIAPWNAVQSKRYTCIAIRYFDDIYKAGGDVYTEFYAPYGAVNGATIKGSPFSFANEAKLFPNIVTLRSDDNELIYVPDTFIASFPDVSTVKYSQVVLAISLGGLPDQLDVTNVKLAVADKILEMFGVHAQVIETRAPTIEQPTELEHQMYEQNRLAAITQTESDRETIVRLQNKVAELQENLILMQQNISG